MPAFPAEISSMAIVLIMLISFFVMGKAADLIVRALINFGKIFKINLFALSFVLLGITTSLPEMVIGAYAVLDEVPRLAFGNLLGGVIVLLTFIMGINGLMFGGIAIDGKFARYSMCRILPHIPWCNRLGIHDLGVIAALLLAPALLFIDGTLSRIDGGILVLFYVFFIWYYMRGQQHSVSIGEEAKIPSFFRNAAEFFAGAVLLVIIARVVIDSSEMLLHRFSIPPFFFGMFALGIGTNLPELIIMLRARKGVSDVSAGNILGSAAANIMILGFLSIVSPLDGFGRGDMLFSGWTLAAATLLLIIFFRTHGKVSRLESIILILMYMVFLIIQNVIRIR